MEFRKAQREDAALILEFIKGIANYEKLSDQVINTVEQIEEVVFDRHKAEVIFALEQGREVGFALFFENYSTFTGRTGIYLEDLFVWPQFRKKGYGKGLFLELARIAKKRGCRRMEWVCLNWNQPSIDFYHSLGARGLKEWTTFRLNEEGIDALARQ